MYVSPIKSRRLPAAQWSEQCCEFGRCLCAADKDHSHCLPQQLPLSSEILKRIWSEPTQHCTPGGWGVCLPIQEPKMCNRSTVFEPPLSNLAWVWLFSDNSAMNNLFLKTSTFNLSQKLRVGTLVHHLQSIFKCYFESRASRKQCYTGASFHKWLKRQRFPLQEDAWVEYSNKRSKTVII